MVAGWHRRTVASFLAGLAVLLAIASTRPAPEPTVELWAAARDLRSGETLAASDVVRVHVPERAAPDGALAEPALIGRVVAAPVRRGEPLTDVRVVGRSLLAGYGSGLVVSPVRLSDAGVARLLAVGDVIDVLAADGGTGLDVPTSRSARTVARAARVVLVPAPDDAALAGEPASLVLLATAAGDAAALAQAAAGSRLSAVLRQ